MKIEQMLTEADGFREEAVALRRDFHKYAESGWLEFRTTAKIAEYLEQLEIPFVMGNQAVNPEYIMEEPAAEEKAGRWTALYGRAPGRIWWSAPVAIPD